MRKKKENFQKRLYHIKCQRLIDSMLGCIQLEVEERIIISNPKEDQSRINGRISYSLTSSRNITNPPEIIISGQSLKFRRIDVIIGDLDIKVGSGARIRVQAVTSINVINAALNSVILTYPTRDNRLFNRMGRTKVPKEEPAATKVITKASFFLK